MKLTSTVTKASCGLTDGSITVTVNRGTAPYQYSIDGLNFQSSNAFTGLATGYYTVTVKDANGFVQTQFAEVQDDCPQVTTVVTDALCGASDGVITASPLGGVSPYTYSIDGGSNYQASPVFSGLAPGNYTIMIKDSRGLTGSTQAIVKDRCMQFTLTPSSTTCGNHNGGIVVNVTNGAAPFQYSLDGSTWQGSPIFNGLASGNYSVTAKDATSLTITKPVTVANIAGPGIQVSPQPAGCNGLGGSLTITGTGGTGALYLLCRRRSAIPVGQPIQQPEGGRLYGVGKRRESMHGSGPGQDRAGYVEHAYVDSEHHPCGLW